MNEEEECAALLASCLSKFEELDNVCGVFEGK